MGGDCASRTTYAVSNNMVDEQVIAVLGRLMDVRSQAAREGPLPFELICTDEPDLFGDSVCGNGGRSALASLPLDRVSRINPVYNHSCVRVVFEYPEDNCPPDVTQAERRIEFWEIEFANAAGRGLTWIVGLAGETITTAIEIQRDSVIYH